MKAQSLKPVSRIMAGDVLIASILRTGNGRPGSPVRWHIYWSPHAERMGARPVEPCTSLREAELRAMLWADLNMDHAPRVEKSN